MTGDTDAALVEAARRGDERAIAELLRTTYDRVFPLCVRLLGDRRAASTSAASVSPVMPSRR